MPDMDDAYANAPHIEGADDYPAAWAAAAEAFRASLGHRARLDVSYGPSERMAYDHFQTEGDSKGTLIFVHGGYWIKFGRSDWSHLAAGALARGWAVAMPSYDLCPSVRIAGITQQVAQAVTQVVRDSDGPISLAGHSAGGHLAARMMAPGMLPAWVHDRMIHAMPISPLSDLLPLLQTSMNADFGLDEAMARVESPVHQPAPDVPATVWVGAEERPAFLDQARWLAEAWVCDHVKAESKHHFNVIDALTDPGSEMIRRLTTAP